MVSCLQGICADTAAHEPDLAAILKAAVVLEEESGPNVELGEREAEERFRNASNQSKQREASLSDTLSAAVKADKDLCSLIQALEEVHDPLASHQPIRVRSEEIKQQLEQLQVRLSSGAPPHHFGVTQASPHTSSPHPIPRCLLRSLKPSSPKWQRWLQQLNCSLCNL